MRRAPHIVGAAAAAAIAALAAGGLARAEPPDAVVGAVRNPFARPALAEPAGAAAEPAELPFTLRATLVAGRGSLVNVDGRIVRMGAEIDGYRLVAVTEGAAVFSKQGVRHELEIRRADAGADSEQDVGDWNGSGDADDVAFGSAGEDGADDASAAAGGGPAGGGPEGGAADGAAPAAGFAAAESENSR